MKADQQFVEDFLDSNAYVNVVAYWLTSKGITARILPNKLRPDVKVRHKYYDQGDIEITMKVEVKHRGFDFTTQADYPYPTILIDKAYNIRQKIKDLYAYAILSKSGEACAFVLKSTRKHWRKVEKFDNVAKENAVFYEVPKEYAAFVNIK
jgi:hypothetical protein